MMHDGEVAVTAAEVAAAVAAQFPPHAGRTVARVESAGTVIAPFRVGDDLVARLPLVPDATDSFVDRLVGEQAHALELARVLPIAVSRPIGIGAPFAGYAGAWSLWTWLHGDSLDRMPGAADARLARDLAGLIRSIHALPTGGASWNGEGRGGRPLADSDWVRESIVRSAHLVDRDRATAVWERALAAPPHEGPVSPIHGDPMPGNFLVTGGRLSGMVDVALPAFGDPAADLQPAWVLFDEPERGAFLDAMGLDTAPRERGRGWAFEMAIGGLHYYEHSNPTFFRQAGRTLDRLFADS